MAQKDPLEAEIQRLWDAVRHEKELRIQQWDAQVRALELQAAEYERRLDSLNHAHAQAMEAQRLTVSKDVFESKMADLDRWRAQVSTDMAEQRGATQAAARAVQSQNVAIQRRVMILGVVITVVVSAVTVLLRFIPIPSGP